MGPKNKGRGRTTFSECIGIDLVCFGGNAGFLKTRLGLGSDGALGSPVIAATAASRFDEITLDSLAMAKVPELSIAFAASAKSALDLESLSLNGETDDRSVTVSEGVDDDVAVDDAVGSL